MTLTGCKGGFKYLFGLDFISILITSWKISNFTFLSNVTEFLFQGVILLLRKPRKGGKGFEQKLIFAYQGGDGGFRMAYLSFPQFELAEQK